jgi:hypothetical protein
MAKFAMNTSFTDGRYRAEIIVDGCGVKDIPGTQPIIWIEEFEGKLTMYVWADIEQGEPTHTINLSDAMEANRKPDELEVIEPAVRL